MEPTSVSHMCDTHLPRFSPLGMGFPSEFRSLAQGPESEILKGGEVHILTIKNEGRPTYHVT